MPAIFYISDVLHEWQHMIRSMTYLPVPIQTDSSIDILHMIKATLTVFLEKLITWWRSSSASTGRHRSQRND